MAKRYADDMYASDELIARAKKEKQAIHTRMSNLEATHFTAHGYEFERAPGEERFIARKIKRGPQAETSADADQVEALGAGLEDVNE